MVKVFFFFPLENFWDCEKHVWWQEAGETRLAVWWEKLAPIPPYTVVMANNTKYPSHHEDARSLKCQWTLWSESCSVVSDSLQPPWTIQFMEFSRSENCEWVAFPFSRGSSPPRDWTQVSGIAGGFFTSWATREAQECWSGWPIPSPVDLLDPGIELGFPALQADSFPTELSGKPNEP